MLEVVDKVNLMTSSEGSTWCTNKRFESCTKPGVPLNFTLVVISLSSVFSEKDESFQINFSSMNKEEPMTHQQKLNQEKSGIKKRW